MEETTFTSPHPTVIQDSSDPSTLSVPLGQASSFKSKKFPIIGIITSIVVLIALVTGGIFIRQIRVNPSEPSVSPAPQVPAPTPTPDRQLSLVASQSAFIQLQANVASLAGSIQNVIVSDPSLAPPILDLPLGFTN